MKEVTIDTKKGILGSSLLWVSGAILLSIVLALLPPDNIFWYKTAFLMYGLTTILYIANALIREKMLANISTLSLLLSLTLNLTAMIRRSIDSYNLGIFHPPWSNLFEALTFWAFIGGSMYLFLERKYGIRVISIFVLPAILGIYAFAMFKANKDLTPLMPALRSYWLYFHVITAFFGYAGFTVAFGAATAYLLKANFKNNRLIQKILPSENILDEVAYKAIAISFPVWTASIILGAAWANEAWGGYWSWDPKEVWSLIVWLFFGAYLHARQLMGWRGNRVAWLAVFGFITVLICFFAINLYFPGLHSYAGE